MKILVKYKIEVIILFSLIAAYFILRLPNLTLQPIFADEAIYVRWAQVMRAEPTLRFVSVTDGKTPLFMWFLIPIFKIFKDPLFAGRFLSVVSGFFTLLGVFFLTKKVFNIKAALWASFFYVITPYTVFFDRMALVDSMLSSFTIWIIYFAIWLRERLRLDLAMILGYLMGGAILTKTPGLINLLILPFSIIAFKRQGKNSLLKLFILWGVTIVIALIMYNMLRLGPEFNKLSSRNADYVFSFQELKPRPLDPFIPHFHDMSDWFPKLFTIPTLIFIALGIFYSLKKFNNRALVVLIWTAVPLLFSMTFLRTFTARYLLTSIAPSLVFAGYGLNQLLEKVKFQKSVKVIVALIIVLPLSLQFDYQLLVSPPPQSLPKEERIGYFEDWTAGYGFKDIANYILGKSQPKAGHPLDDKKVVLGTDGFFGTLPDGIQIYLDKANVAIVGSTATISAQVRNAARDNKTYFIGNKKNLEGKVKNVILIKEYPKAKSADGSFDSTVLYQVLP
ncbi:MAG: glycosyltransferase family 39 protein [Candidatus Daviesbacteria bacterium]|nr:glycosyltransferase family 39 protein [Candidatus Daviesbacteria bacterium]